jgi:hypothetical protein
MNSFFLKLFESIGDFTENFQDFHFTGKPNYSKSDYVFPVHSVKSPTDWFLTKCDLQQLAAFCVTLKVYCS